MLPLGVANSQGNFGTGYACGGVYGDSTCLTFLVPAANAGALSPSVLNASGEAAFNLVRVGLNYRF